MPRGEDMQATEEQGKATITVEVAYKFLDLYREKLAVQLYYPERTNIDFDLKVEALDLISHEILTLIPNSAELNRVISEAATMTRDVKSELTCKLDVLTSVLITRTHSQVFECATGTDEDGRLKDQLQGLYEEMTDDERAEATLLVNMNADHDLKRIPKEYNQYRFMAIKRCKRRCLQGVVQRTADLIRTRKVQEANKSRPLSSSVYLVTCPVTTLETSHPFEDAKVDAFLGSHVRLFLRDPDKDMNELVWVACDGFWNGDSSGDDSGDELTGVIAQEPEVVDGYSIPDRVSFSRREIQDQYTASNRDALLDYMAEILKLAGHKDPVELTGIWGHMSDREKMHIFQFTRNLRDLKPGTLPMKTIHGGYPG